MNIRVKNEIGNGKEIKLGYSWTMLFIGILVPLIRTDWKWSLIIFGGSIILFFLGLTSITPFLILMLSFFYNKIYAKDLYEKGFRGLTPEEDEEFKKYIADWDLT